jgi:hypothetical protein
MRQQAESQKQQLENNPNLTPEQRRNALAAISRETQQTVAQMMGDKAFQAYQRGSGAWMRGLGLSSVPDDSEADIAVAPNTAARQPAPPFPPLPPGFPQLPPPPVPIPNLPPTSAPFPAPVNQ